VFERLLERLLRRAATLSARADAPADDRSAAERCIEAGRAAERSGKSAEACGHYRQAVAAAPGYAKAHLELGIGLEATGDAEGALAAYREAVGLDAADPYASYNLGRLLQARGDLREAERLVRAALARKPDFVEARIVLAGIHEIGGALAAAAGELEIVLRRRPEHPGALLNYGLLLAKQGRAPEAESALRRVLAADPGSASASHRLASMLLERGEAAEAERLFKAALERDPALVEAHVRLFELFRKRGDIGAAAAQLARLLEHRPDWADAWYDYGLMLKKLFKRADAEAAFRRAVALDPRHVGAQRMLGGMLLSQARVEEALASYALALQHNPGQLEIESAEMFARLFVETTPDDELFARHRALGARIEAAFPARYPAFGDARDPERRLRVGYVSGDFSYHPVALFLLPLLERHDRSAFEIHAYSVGDNVDDVTRRASAVVDGWHEASALSAQELADAIHGDAIDILVDLSGHSGVSALATFALQPAPVQATWLGYLGTTGMTRMHWRLCDRHTDPAGVAERFHTEALARLPNSQWCYRPVFTEAPSEPPSARNGFVTFGSFNQGAKLSPSTRALWAEILGRVPGSRLAVLDIEGPGADAFVADLSRRGIDPARVTIVPRVPPADYFRWFNRVDVALDTTPYSGGTTTCDTLWMGVPIVTVPGSRPASRSTASILTSVGASEWIAATPADYVRLAVELAAKPPAGAHARPALRERMRRSPIMDEPRFARDVEAAYRGMWRTWCGRGT
jgi:protein O-GlcNAc transferase